MPLKFLKSLFSRSGAAQAEPTDLPGLMARDAARFAKWAEAQTGRPAPLSTEGIPIAEEALEKARAAAGTTVPMDEALASDAAAFFGEVARRTHDGRWEEHERLGLVLNEPGHMFNSRLIPLAMVEKKWELGNGLSLARFFATIPDRLEVESQNLAYHQEPSFSPKEIGKEVLMTGLQDPSAPAVEQTETFRTWWKGRHKVDLPLSLQGLREVEAFLRSQFFLFALHEETLIQAGFFLGEVARGLYEGRWDMEPVADGNDPLKAELKWPELTYYPVSKVYKFVTERPEGDGLVEYVQVIPSARKELRDQGSVGA